jgi:hypothetical protein
MGADLPLGDQALLIGMDKFKGVFNGDNMGFTNFIDIIDDGGKGG